MTRKELERTLEERCVARVEALGGMALKLMIPGVRGFPDRTILMPGGRVWFVEIKRNSLGVTSAQQLEWARRLRGLGFVVAFVDNDAEFERYLETMRAE